MPSARMKRRDDAEKNTELAPHKVSRPVQRAWDQDEYMNHFEEADALPPGGLRPFPSNAPMTSDETLQAIKALEEAPDGFRRLDWSGQGLSNLPPISKAMQNARVVMLNDNRLTSFPQELSQLRLMQKLRIESNSISGVPSYINSFPLLQDLRACDNSITSLSGNIGRCSYLRIIDLQRNQLSALPPNIGALTNLEKLLLTNNRIREIPITLSRLCSLHTFRIDKNQVAKFGFNVAQMTSLTQLRIGHNLVTYVPGNIGDAKSLIELSVENNLIESLPPSICELKLQTLRVEANPLKRPPLEVCVRGAETVFRFLKRTQYAVETWKMDLSRFKLKFVPFPDLQSAAAWEIMTWCNIQHLSLGNNRLVSLPVEINMMSNLTILDVNSNKLATVPPSVGTLPRLQVLDAASNAIQALPGNMRANVQLQELLLENNRLTTIPLSVADLESLLEIRIPSNRLTKVPEHIGGATALTHLSLEHNEIRTLSHGLTALANLLILDLSHNAITEVTTSLVKIRPNEDPPTHHAHQAEEGGRIQLGSIVNPEIRRERIRLVLSGGKRPQWRLLGPVVLDEMEYERPPGCGQRRRWDLVRFALFGENGPHLQDKKEPEVVEEEEEEEGSVDSNDSDESAIISPRKGFVQRFRLMLFRKKEKVIERPKTGDSFAGNAEENQKGGDGADPEEEAERAADADAAEKKSIFASLSQGLSSVAGQFATVKRTKVEKDDQADDHGAYLISLIELNLSFNMIESLPTDIGNLSTLLTLRLEHNKLQSVPRSFNTLDKITDLNLSQNYIMECPKELAKLVSLRRLDLSHQGDGTLLDELPNDLRSLVLLEELRLSGNSFKNLPECMLPDDAGVGFINLRVFAMDSNPLEEIDEDIAVCAKMERLLLHSTKIKTLHKSITFMYKLQELWVADTDIRKLDPALANLVSLRKIVLSHEDQLQDFADIRRTIRGEVWSFLRPGEGEVATLSALAKFEDIEQRQRTRRAREEARATGSIRSRPSEREELGDSSEEEDGDMQEEGGASFSETRGASFSETGLSFDVNEASALGSTLKSTGRDRGVRGSVSFGADTQHEFER